MTARTYYPPAEADTPSPTFACATPGCGGVTKRRCCDDCCAAPGAVRHGYTLNDLHGMARAAIVADRLMAMPSDHRYDIALSAIALALCEPDGPTDRQTLVRVGWQAIYRHVRDGLRERGHRDTAEPSMSRYVMFWGSGIVPSPEDRIVERVATEQVMRLLHGPCRDAVLALAVHDDYKLAAESLGINYGALTTRLRTARRAVHAAWFEGETPPRVRTDRRVASHTTELATHCSSGHEWTPENTRVERSLLRGKARQARRCRTCQAERDRQRHAAPSTWDGQPESVVSQGKEV